MNSQCAPIPVVRLIVEDAARRVLCLRRAKGTAAGSWCLPGGKIDYGDTVEAAAARELEEETGLRLTRARFLFYQDSLPYADGGMHCINFYFACEVEGDIVLNEESTVYTWLEPKDLSRYEIAFRNNEGIARYTRERATNK